MAELEKRAKRLEERMRKLTEALQGDPQWKQKGILEQIEEINGELDKIRTTQDEYGEYDHEAFHKFMLESKDLQKRVLWTAGIFTGLTAIVWAIISQLDNIEKLVSR